MASSLNGTGITFSNGQTQSYAAVGTDGQSWQNVTGSRANGVTYTNTTGRPIQVCVSIINASASSAVMDVIVDGVYAVRNLGRATYCNVLPADVIVPAGSTYSLESVVTINGWAELR